jgi:glyoxylase-like metal-dependent hydrolase (beta-lactamase superfamily II)
MTSADALGAGLLRLRAANPSPLTGSGTNTYLLGTTELAIIDPGPDLDSHLEAILAAVGGRIVSHILVTHAHRDHSALAPRLADRTGAAVLAFGTVLDGMSPRMAALRGIVPSSGEGLDLAFTPDIRLADDARISGPDWTLQVLHTPGHLGGHLCLALGDILFSGDHVMGWASTIVSPPEGDMGDYMASLRRLQRFRWGRMLPGHGDPIEDPASRLKALLAHRHMREGQIIEALALGPADAKGLTLRIYADINPSLRPAAERNVLAHLLDLEARSLVEAEQAPAPFARFRSR